MRVFLPQQIESNVPHRNHIFGSMVLPDAAAVFIECDVQRPMELILNIPMLANHGDEGGGRPHQTGNVGFDHGAGHPLLFLDDPKAPNYRKNKGFKGLGNYSEWPKVAGAMIELEM